MQDLNLDELRVAYGIDKDNRFISVHLVALNLGPLKSRVLLAFLCSNRVRYNIFTLLQKAGKLLGAHGKHFLMLLINALLHLSSFPLEVDGVYRDICSSHV